MGEIFALGVGTLPIGGLHCSSAALELLEHQGTPSSAENPKPLHSLGENPSKLCTFTHLLSSVRELRLRAGSTERLFSSSLPDLRVARSRRPTAR